MLVKLLVSGNGISLSFTVPLEVGQLDIRGLTHCWRQLLWSVEELQLLVLPCWLTDCEGVIMCFHTGQQGDEECVFKRVNISLNNLMRPSSTIVHLSGS